MQHTPPAPPTVRANSIFQTSYVKKLKVDELIVNYSSENVVDDNGIISSVTNVTNVTPVPPVASYKGFNSIYSNNGLNNGGHEMAYDSENNVYIMGNLGENGNGDNTYTINRNGLPSHLTSENNRYGVIKYDKSGKVVSKLLFSAGFTGYSMCVDINDNLYIAGKLNIGLMSVYNFTTSDSNTFMLEGSAPDIVGVNVVILKYSKDGGFISWVRLDGMTTREGIDVQTDSNGNLYALMSAQIETGDGVIYIPNFTNLPDMTSVLTTMTLNNNSYVLIKWDINGNFSKWTYLELDRNMFGFTSARQLCISPLDDSVWLCANYEKLSLTTQVYNFVNTNTPTSSQFIIPETNGGSSVLIIKWKSDGMADMWNVPFNTSLDCLSSYIAIDRENNIYLSGFFSLENVSTSIRGFSKTSTIGTVQGNTRSCYYSSYVVKWNTNGTYNSYTLLNDPLSDSYSDYKNSLVLDSIGNVYLTGTYKADINPVRVYSFSSVPNTSEYMLLPQISDNSQFTVKWDSSGSIFSYTNIISDGSSEGFHSIIDNDDNLYTFGLTGILDLTFSDFTKTGTMTNRIDYKYISGLSNFGSFTKWNKDGILDLGTYTTPVTYTLGNYNGSNIFTKTLILNTVNYKYIIKTEGGQLSVVVYDSPKIIILLWNGTKWIMT